MITRSSTAKQKDSNTVSPVKLSLPEPQVSEMIAARSVLSESVMNHTNVTAQSVSSCSVSDKKANQFDGLRRPSILDAADKHKDAPMKIYWESKEARNLFRPIDNETVQQAIEAQIQLLTDAFNDTNWKAIVDPEANVDGEFSNVPGSILDVKEKAMALSVALDLAKRDKPTKTWAQCCEEAVNLIYREGNLIDSVKPPSPFKLQEWYREFREHRFFVVSKAAKKRIKQDAETARLKKELNEVKQVNAALVATIEKRIPKVKASSQAADLLAEIERDMAKIQISGDN